MIRCLARSSSTTSLLVKDGIVTTMEKIVTCLGFASHTKLRLSLNVINCLTKNRVCCIKIVKSGLLILLLRIFERWERYEGKVRVKVCSYILVTLQHLCSTKIGCRTLCRLNGMTLVSKFCTRCPDDKSYDPLLARVCYIINMCLDRKQLPVQSSLSPATCTLPALKDIYTYSEMDVAGKRATSAHGTSTGLDEDSCEDFLQQEEEECDDDYDDDSDDDSYKGKRNIGTSNMALPVQRNTEDLFGYEHYFKEFGSFREDHYRNMLLKSSVHWDANLPCCGNLQFGEKNCKGNCHVEMLSDPMFSQFCSYKMPSLADDICEVKPVMNAAEYDHTIDINDETFNKKNSGGQSTVRSLSSVMSTLEANKNGVSVPPISNRNCDDSSMMTKGLDTIADIPKDSGLQDVYAKVASQVNSVLPFIKMAYPDMMGGTSSGALEPLYVKDRRVCRAKLLTCVERRTTEFEGLKKVVYDMDTLVTKLPLQKQNNNTDRVLFNSDEMRLGQRDTTKTHLCFESRFESGNLRKALQVSPNEYDLILMPDVNSTHHHQWFYFEVSNMEADVPYVFNIVNCEKQNSQFNHGMKPLMYSVCEAILGRPGWIRVGTDICYYRNCYQNLSSRKSRSYLTAAFTVTFPHSYDVCYIAYHYPYTYSQLLAQIWQWSLSVDPAAIYFRAESICLSLNNNETPLITITAAESETNPIAMRDIIFLTARVHPGESNSSWVMHGTIVKLLDNSPSAISARSMFVFKVVPMLNVEGVINGCHRCDLTNEDLNRHWSRPNQHLHPSIYHTKGLLEYCVRVLKKPPYVFCDYHGHSRRKNVFLYGCSNSDSWNEMDRSVPDGPVDYLMLPRLMQHFSPAFALQLCKFSVERGRESTARVTVWREFGIKRSYTMETSYCGFDQGLYEGHHVDIVRLKEIGEHFCDALTCLRNESYWRTGVIAYSPGPLRWGLTETFAQSAPEGSESDQSDCSEYEEDRC